MEGVIQVYKNLREALRAKNITLKGYADFLGVSEKTVLNKINQETEFTYTEFKKTCNDLLPEYNPNFLFTGVQSA